MFNEPEPEPIAQQEQLQDVSVPLWDRFYQLEKQLCEELKMIELPANVTTTYDPIQYAAGLHEAYLQRFLDGPKAVIFLGINPGPWGMCQTGVPFGHVPAVRDWMNLEGLVQKPPNEHPKRPVQGLDCTRSEQSGKRLWGLFEDLCGTAENFFRHCFVWNICTLAFFNETGQYIAPADVKGSAKASIEQVCTKYLKKAVTLFEPEIVVCIGRYTEKQVKKLDPTFNHCYLLHPSPKSPRSNTNWTEVARQCLVDNGVMPYLQPQSQ